jgi:L-seryl-tRNA(Ser) seleniumtransferase
MAKPTSEGAGALRALPKIDELLTLAERGGEFTNVPRTALRAAARRVVAKLRERIQDGNIDGAPAPDVELMGFLRDEVDDARELSLARVVNATGVILHTGLGRAPLAEAAVRAIVSASQSCALEIEKESGERGQRDSVVSQLLTELTGAGDATVVNNNAAATLLAVNTFARGLKVIVSRGELVEIGGSYRMPSVIRRGGAKLVEVGTTNRTRIQDYRDAITDKTGLIMKVHTSNYRIRGFTEEATLEELVKLGHDKDIPVVHDLGSGLLGSELAPALEGEPTVAESIAAGPDLVLFSGDKLLGGPQSGILIGKKKAVEAIRKNPMYRAMRLDKLILAALEATLRCHVEGDAAATIPTIERLNLAAPALRARAEALRTKIGKSGAPLEAAVVESTSEAGSGSAPTIPLQTFCVGLSHAGFAAAELARRLRLSRPSVFARVRDDRVLLDPRTLGPGDDERVVEAIRHAFGSES